MKAMRCEACGNTDLVKQGDFFVCQFCGVKYTPEEARKLIVEGTVKIDNTGSIDNYFTMAKNAADAKNYAEAESYCNKIIEIDPTNSDAWLLKGESAGWESTVANCRIEESFQCFLKALEHVAEDKKDDMQKAVIGKITVICTAYVQLCLNHFGEYPGKDAAASIINALTTACSKAGGLYEQCGAKESFPLYCNVLATLVSKYIFAIWDNKITPEFKNSNSGHPDSYDLQEFFENTVAAITVVEAAIKAVEIGESFFGAGKGKGSQDNVGRYKGLIVMRTALTTAFSYKYGEYGYVADRSLTLEAKNQHIDVIMQYHQKIKEIDPTYVIPQRPVAKKGCYVATAVYGSYDCPQVWTLRRYRDDRLAKTRRGRAFIHTYYAISPTLVKWFGDTTWFKQMWQGKLDRMVQRLNEEGVENTPYNDRPW
ncbi:MAG: hypothetical protein IJU16_04125 [Clostridia bacterium]|nr:hypothetical protein [Clostridia bacterium]